MDGRTLKLAAAGCFAVTIMATAVASRFDVAGSFANVYATLDSEHTGEAVVTVATTTPGAWRSSLTKYTTISPETASTATSLATSSMTMTDTFARALFESYLRNRDSLDSTESRVTFAQNYAEVLQAATQQKTYTNADMKIQSTATFREYIPAIAQAIAGTSGVREHELVIMERLSQGSGDAAADTQSLVAISENYKKIEGKLLQIAVPYTASSTHTAFVNAVVSLHSHIFDMSKITEDGLRGAIALQKYVAAVDDMKAAIAVIQLKVHLEQITFPESSLAAKFMNL